MFDNEEDVKNKIVVPCLKLLGFNDSEIFYEKSLLLGLFINTIQRSLNLIR
jgi:hypothetical protein